MLVNPATIIKYVREYGRAKKDNTEKLATYGTQDEENKIAYSKGNKSVIWGDITLYVGNKL
jgi:hypothetical protein